MLMPYVLEHYCSFVCEGFLESQDMFFLLFWGDLGLKSGYVSLFLSLFNSVRRIRKRSVIQIQFY